MRTSSAPVLTLSALDRPTGLTTELPWNVVFSMIPSDAPAADEPL